MKTSPQAPIGKHEHQPPPTGPGSPLESAALFGKPGEGLIAHGRETYPLRRTRQGKLILTK